jgi:MarR family transcriptional regulator for hemolysin
VDGFRDLAALVIDIRGSYIDGMDANITSTLGFLIGDVTRLYRREFDRRAAPLGLTRVQWRALRRLSRFEGMTQVKLAEDLELAPIAVGRVLDRLEKSGFIERRADPTDRRCWRLHLAPGSAKVMAGVDQVAQELREEVFADFPMSDLEAAERVLSALKTRLGGQCKASDFEDDA